ncbi:hypothetical protein OKW98_08185 [Pseudomonas sp. KU26590]|uniref:hypothetical protein n=1 Tax=Pseudomonas sp. KU26590 TaxID=2991051 RepID=UPI00223D6A92|nr:hypothetical protein [Pseudomonas sp. KU26590]UZJ61681.1 hypothetical protein OKW98_08185 [Pseudomonas sp. KU26590]
MSQVPNAYLGVWKRRLIQRRSGHSDSETAVYWLQTPRLFADLRIPNHPLPGLALEKLSDAQHLALSEQQGFAGVTQVDTDICQWHRNMDYQPVNGDEDIGRMHFETSDCLIETALDDSYYEIWDRLPRSVGVCRGQWLQAVDDPTRQACLLLAGDYFLFAASRPEPLPPGPDLRTLLSHSESREKTLSLLACELSFGQHSAGEAPWKIECSTLPANIGQVLLPASVDPNAPDLFASEAVLSSLGTFMPPGGWCCAPDP